MFTTVEKSPIMQIKIHDGSSVELPDGATAKELAEKLNFKGPGQALAARINDTLVDLTTALKDGDEVHLVDFDSPEGKDLFWHSSAHVLAQAVLRLWPEAQATIGPAIKDGFYYDFANLSISDSDLPKIEKEMKKIISENHKPQREEFTDKRATLDAFGDNVYKVELIHEFDDAGPFSAYRQGEFVDLCRGPHLPNLGKIKAVKLVRLAGAYWRGDSSREMLTRIYGISFPDRLQLKEHLQRIEEAKKRDHRLLGQKLDLFSLKEEAPGMPFIHPKGMLIWNTLIDFWRKLHKREGYEEIKTPMMMVRDLWERSGHWQNYRENMFCSLIEDRDFAIKPMNCPGACLYYRTHTHSYRELPWRVAEMGNVHRYEPSGALSGLFRVRSFHQDDAHIFMKPEDIEQEILGVLRFAEDLYSTFGLRHHLELSTRPEKDTIGTDEEWETATNGLKAALDKTGRDYVINEGDGAFYGPKIDMHIEDALGRTWQCGTIQLDMALPQKFNLEYVDSDGSRKVPVTIHRVLYGSLERFLGILIEHFGGRLPLWLSPRQVRIITVADRHEPYARELKEAFDKAGILCEVDDTGESVSKKVRNAQLFQVNYILTVGDKEVEHRTINVRTRDNIVHGEANVEEMIDKLSCEIKEKSLTSILSDKE